MWSPGCINTPLKRKNVLLECFLARCVSDLAWNDALCAYFVGSGLRGTSAGGGWGQDQLRYKTYWDWDVDSDWMVHRHLTLYWCSKISGFVDFSNFLHSLLCFCKLTKFWSLWLVKKQQRRPDEIILCCWKLSKAFCRVLYDNQANWDKTCVTVLSFANSVERELAASTWP